jgi:hypothetical protein
VVEECGRRQDFDAAVVVPGAQRRVAEQVAVAGHDGVAIAGQSRGDHRSVVGIAGLYLDDGREDGAEEDEELLDVVLRDLLARQLRSTEGGDQLAGEFRGGDCCDSALAPELEHLPWRAVRADQGRDPDVRVNDDARRAPSGALELRPRRSLSATSGSKPSASSTSRRRARSASKRRPHSSQTKRSRKSVGRDRILDAALGKVRPDLAATSTSLSSVAMVSPSLAEATANGRSVNRDRGSRFRRMGTPRRNVTSPAQTGASIRASIEACPGADSSLT